MHSDYDFGPDGGERRHKQKKERKHKKEKTYGEPMGEFGSPGGADYGAGNSPTAGFGSGGEFGGGFSPASGFGGGADFGGGFGVGGGGSMGDAFPSGGADFGGGFGGGGGGSVGDAFPGSGSDFGGGFSGGGAMGGDFTGGGCGEGSKRKHPKGKQSVSYQEEEYYQELFSRVDTHHKGSIDGLSAADFLMSTGLPEGILHRIWEIADSDYTGELKKEGWYAAMRLVAHAQAGREPSPELVMQEPPALPDFEGMKRQRDASEVSPPPELAGPYNSSGFDTGFEGEYGNFQPVISPSEGFGDFPRREAAEPRGFEFEGGQGHGWSDAGNGAGVGGGFEQGGFGDFHSQETREPAGVGAFGGPSQTVFDERHEFGGGGASFGDDHGDRRWESKHRRRADVGAFDHADAANDFGHSYGDDREHRELLRGHFSATGQADRALITQLQRELRNCDKEMEELGDSRRQLEEGLHRDKHELQMAREQLREVEGRIRGLRQHLTSLRGDRRDMSLEMVSVRRQRHHFEDKLEFVKRILLFEEGALQKVRMVNAEIERTNQEVNSDTDILEHQRKGFLATVAKERELLKTEQRKNAEIKNQVERLQREAQMSIVERQRDHRLNLPSPSDDGNAWWSHSMGREQQRIKEAGMSRGLGYAASAPALDADLSYGMGKTSTSLAVPLAGSIPSPTANRIAVLANGPAMREGV